jgi:hypothetical protein
VTDKSGIQFAWEIITKHEKQFDLPGAHPQKATFHRIGVEGKGWQGSSGKYTVDFFQYQWR